MYVTDDPGVSHWLALLYRLVPVAGPSPPHESISAPCPYQKDAVCRQPSENFFKIGIFFLFCPLLAGIEPPYLQLIGRSYRFPLTIHFRSASATMEATGVKSTSPDGIRRAPGKSGRHSCDDLRCIRRGEF